MNPVTEVLWLLANRHLTAGLSEDIMDEIRGELEDTLAGHKRAVAFLDFMESGPDHDQPMLAAEWLDDFDSLSQPV